MSDLAAQLTRTTTISHQRAQDLIDEVTRLGFNAAQVVQMSPDDPVEMLEFVSQIAKREMLADVRWVSGHVKRLRTHLKEDQ